MWACLWCICWSARVDAPAVLVVLSSATFHSGTSSSIHFDTADNILAQVDGEKVRQAA
jgi:hypothetical protein